MRGSASQSTQSINISTKITICSKTLYFNRSLFLWHNTSVATKTSHAPRCHQMTLTLSIFRFLPLSCHLCHSVAFKCCYRVFTLNFSVKFLGARARVSIREAIFISQFSQFLCLFPNIGQHNKINVELNRCERTKIVSWKLNCECAQTERRARAC